MMGFTWLLLIAGAAAALLWRIGLPRLVWSMAGAAVMLGATGYALQGRPLLGGAPREAGERPIEVEQGLVELRGDLFDRYTRDGSYLLAADALTRSGDTDSAAQVVLGGIRNDPASAMLWTGLGDVLARHDGDQVSPPALFAFQQAIRLAPEHPGPPFFLGLAYVRAQRLAEAAPYWQRALALCPPGAPYRVPIAQRVLLLDTYLRQIGAAQP